MRRLIAHQNIGAALNHLARPSTVFVAISKPMGFQLVKKNRWATLNRLPCIGSATSGVNTSVRNTKSRLIIHEDICRSGGRRADAGVWTTWQMMRVHRHARLIAESRLGTHNEKNITHNSAFCDKKWQ